MNWHYLYIFMQSNLLEVLVVAYWLRKVFSIAQILTYVTISNAVSHPVVFFLGMHLPMSYLTDVVISETFAIVVEAFIYQRLLGVSKNAAWSGSLFANVVSWQMAPILTALVWFHDRL